MDPRTVAVADPALALQPSATPAADAAPIIERARQIARRNLAAHDANAVAAAFAIPVPGGRLLAPDEIDHPDLSGLDGPFAVKFISPAAVHKSDLGAVRIGVAAADVASVCRQMLDSDPLRELECDGLLVEEMATGAAELVIGGRTDESFGPVVMVGLGGVLLEIFDDVSFRICPVDDREARTMLSELRASSLLFGYRGGDRVNIDAVVDVIVKVAGADGLLMTFAEQIGELDINPLIVGVDAALACDVRVVLADQVAAAPHGSDRSA